MLMIQGGPQQKPLSIMCDHWFRDSDGRTVINPSRISCLYISPSLLSLAFGISLEPYPRRQHDYGSLVPGFRIACDEAYRE